MSKHKKQDQDLTFEESIKIASKKELRKIVKHFHELNMMAVSENYELANQVRSLQDELSQEKSNVNHKNRILKAIANS